MSIFQFKQFSVDQRNCAMKINTDGTLLAALAESADPQQILDLGTGTGVIAMMLAQRFKNARLDAVEIDADAAQTAGANFSNSPFANRLHIFPLSFQEYFNLYPGSRYDLMVSNPPFFLNSLKNPDEKKNIARHTDLLFFDQLLTSAAAHLKELGKLVLVLPQGLAPVITAMAAEKNLCPVSAIHIRSFADYPVHRCILSFSARPLLYTAQDFTIYTAARVYSDQFREALKDFFTIF